MSESQHTDSESSSEYSDTSNEVGDHYKFTEEMRNKLASCTVQEMLSMPFVIVSFNVVRSECQYYLSEMAMIKFSIKDGILNKFHRFLDSGTLPGGKNHCFAPDSVGNVRDPVTNQYLVETRKLNFMNFLAEIDDFFQDYPGQFPDEIRPPLKTFYVDDSHLDQCESSFYYISEQAQLSAFYSNLKICRISDLVFQLCLKKRVSFSVLECKTDLFSVEYPNYDNCAQHQDSSYLISCAFGSAIRLAYKCCRILCPLFGVVTTPNHCPPDHLLKSVI